MNQTLEQKIETLSHLIKQDAYYVPRDYKTIGGMWTVDTWVRSGVSLQLMDEGYTKVIQDAHFRVICSALKPPVFERGNVQCIDDWIEAFSQKTPSEGTPTSTPVDCLPVKLKVRGV